MCSPTIYGLNFNESTEGTSSTAIYPPFGLPTRPPPFVGALLPQTLLGFYFLGLLVPFSVDVYVLVFFQLYGRLILCPFYTYTVLYLCPFMCLFIQGLL